MADRGPDDEARIPIGTAVLMVIGLLALGAALGFTIDWIVGAPNRSEISAEGDSP